MECVESDTAFLIDRVIAELGKIISEPKLTRELLSEPSLRYVCDIVLAIIKETGFGKESYQLDRSLEKLSPALFLNKILSKIGHQQVRTNLFFNLHIAATKKIEQFIVL